MESAAEPKRRGARFRKALSTRYIHMAEPNKCRALNEGIATLRDELIFFCDDDVVVGRSTLAAYARVALAEDGGVFCGGPVTAEYEVPPPRWLLPYLPASARGWTPAETAKAEESPPRFIGFNWAAFADDLRRAGGFDERLGPGLTTSVRVGDESEMQKRLLASGVRPVYVADAVVQHAVPAERCSLEWAAQRAYQIGAWRILDRGLNGDRCVFGYPAWVLRRIFASSIRHGMAAMSRDIQKRFAARYDNSYDKGLMFGVSLYRRWADS